jgi:hypothetical protein
MRISQGYILLQRFFDIGDGIQLHMAEKAVSATSLKTRFTDASHPSHLASPPLEVQLPKHLCGVPGIEACETHVKLYAIGAMAITFKIPLPDACTPETLLNLACNIHEHHTEVTHVARTLQHMITQTLGNAIQPGGNPSLMEDYTVFYIQAFHTPLPAAQVLEHWNIPNILMADKEPLAHHEKNHVMKSSFSYRPDDVVVIDWNSAFISDPTGNTDVADILEIATVQLLELRVYDALAAEALATLYSALEPGHTFSLFSSNKYNALSHKVMQHFIDVLEIAEKIDHALMFLGDTWLARIHHAASQEFAIPRWHAQLRNKLEMLKQINEMLVDRVTSQKSFTLEIAIVGLIVLEIVLALLNAH